MSELNDDKLGNELVLYSTQGHSIQQFNCQSIKITQLETLAFKDCTNDFQFDGHTLSQKSATLMQLSERSEI
jgi:hypothetical protein